MSDNTRDEQVLKQFGSRLKEIRVSKNITQEQLSVQINVPQSTIGRIERGVSNPKLCLLVTIAKALNCEMKDFF